MSNVITLRRKPRPLRKTYQPLAPYEVEREDQEDGDITFEVTDMRPDSYRRVCWTNDDSGRNPYAKHDAEQIARGLNLLVQYGKETLPAVRDPEMDMDLIDDEGDDD
jgi:hypothetical protein